MEKTLSPLDYVGLSVIATAGLWALSSRDLIPTLIFLAAIAGYFAERNK